MRFEKLQKIPLISKISKKTITGFALIIIMIILIYAYEWYTIHYPETDNAYIQANVVPIASEVMGPIRTIHVHNNQYVNAGDILLEIDPTPFLLALKMRQAEYQQCKAQLFLNEKNAYRVNSLVTQDKLPIAEQDMAHAKLEAAQAACIAAAQAVEKASLDLKHTQLRVMHTGIVSNFNLMPGAMVVPSTPLFTLIELDQWWVDANFKETQLKYIKKGQEAKITVDLDSHKTLKGKVDSISYGSGAAFSLFPPENATGNWVKVTQRFPVRISIIMPKKYTNFLRIGASATVKIYTH